MTRLWDKENKYSVGDLKEYKYWALAVSFRQHTLGSYVILCKRNIEKISECSSEEILELKEIMKETEIAMLENPVFKPDRFNYLQLGNGKHLLHFHGIPRYQNEREFLGQRWTDKTFGMPPLWSLKEEAEDLVKALVLEFKKFI